MFRSGPRKSAEEVKLKPRPLIIRFKTSEKADYWCNNGRGYQTESKHWINADLCRADREAGFQARQERNRRKAEAEAQTMSKPAQRRTPTKQTNVQTPETAVIVS